MLGTGQTLLQRTYSRLQKFIPQENSKVPGSRKSVIRIPPSKGVTLTSRLSWRGNFISKSNFLVGNCHSALGIKNYGMLRTLLCIAIDGPAMPGPDPRY